MIIYFCVLFSFWPLYCLSYLRLRIVYWVSSYFFSEMVFFSSSAWQPTFDNSLTGTIFFIDIAVFELWMVFKRYNWHSNWHCLLRYSSLVWLRDICVTNDHGYLPFVKITIQSFPHSWLISRVCIKSNTTDGTYGAVTTYPYETPESSPCIYWGSCCSIFSFLCSIL